ncbi:hypothetical protein, partial [Serratia marcescens]|uniref:hypothetical protein n=1 Tax=Serratia marcescens TaxID=615 RepID=UPI0013DBD432
ISLSSIALAMGSVLLAMRGIDGLPFSWTVASWTQHSSNLTVAIDLPEALPEGSTGPLLDLE